VPRLPFRPVRPARAGALAPLFAAALLTALAAACGDDSSLLGVAQSETALVPFTVYPLSGDASLPAAIDLSGRRAVRPSILGGTVLNFDLAFDLDAQGRILVIPPARLASPPTGTSRVGLQTRSETFDGLTRAPDGGYTFDSTAVLTRGQTLAIEASAATCSTTYPMHAKLVVDSVGAAAAGRPIYLRVRVNPNCGFRSLEPGLPKS
jgi:hypothetical protein